MVIGMLGRKLISETSTLSTISYKARMPTSCYKPDLFYTVKLQVCFPESETSGLVGEDD